MKITWCPFILLLATLSCSSCASSQQTFPHAKWDSVSGDAYGAAFETAIVWKFVRESKHTDYVTFITPARALISTKYVNCEALQFQTEWLSKPGVCAIVGPARHPIGCDNYHGCVAIKMSRSMLADDQYRRWLIEAIKSPCQSLRDPASYPDIRERRMQAGLPYGILLEWDILSCGKPQESHANKFYIDDETGLVIFYLS